MNEKESKRGGKREGAGRPKAEKTVQMRVPVDLVPAIQVMIDKHKTKLRKQAVQAIKELKESVSYEERFQRAYVVALKQINAMSRKERRAIISQYGSIPSAAKINARVMVETDTQKNARTR